MVAPNCLVDALCRGRRRLLLAGPILILGAITYCVLTLRTELSSNIFQSSIIAVSYEKARVEERFAARRRRVEQECQSNPDLYYDTDPRMSPSSILHDKQHGLVYCYIPKNGCSFWKRVFAVLKGSKTGKQVLL